MKNKFLLITASLFFLFSNSYPQQDTTYGWTPAAVVSFNISQIAFSNWTKGGTNAISWTGIANGGVNYRSLDWTFRNTLNLAYGRSRLGSADYRTTDNELYLENVISRNISWPIDPYFSNTLRTAVAPGFDYEVAPPVEIANFFDPGYLTQSLGFLYGRDNFNTRLGFAIQEVFSRNHTQYTDDTTTAEIETFKFETGIESVTTGEFIMAENLLMQSKLRLFSRFNSLDVWDVRWDNAIVAKVNDWLNVNFTYLLIYEVAQSLTAQMKQALQIGFVYTLL